MRVEVRRGAGDYIKAGAEAGGGSVRKSDSW